MPKQEAGRREADHQESMERVELCRSLAASEGSGNKRINERMRGETERGKCCMGKKRRGKKTCRESDAERVQAAWWCDE